ncbi:unnamed protein product [Adineta steineri]|uniref:Uncharacterized protein n=1 Tax=Adineta steineri TaxID=433720 RepID=A0A816E256_9BILA|nr:unnamed protein product [Adineta steineri]CAF1642050.1 unnamed protein product [Adineta steineri]
MSSFYRTLSYSKLHIFVVLLMICNRLTNSQNTTTTILINSTEMSSTANSVITSVETNLTVTSSVTSVSNNLTNPSDISTTTTIITPVNTFMTSSITSQVVNTTSLPDEPSGPGWWLLVALLITIVFVIIAGVIFYRRQQYPNRRITSCSQWYRNCNFRFLQNCRSYDDDTDNIILQLEQSEVTNDQWPPRISFT